MPAPNGPRPRVSTGRNRNSTRNIASKGGNIKTALNRDRTTGVGGAMDKKGSTTVSGTPFDPAASLAKLASLRTKQQLGTISRTALQLPKALDTSGNVAAMTAATQAQANMTALALAAAQRAGKSGYVPRGGGGPLMAQLVKGFRAAGDPRMAKFIKRNPQLARTWLGQESGLDPNAISPANNQGDPNYGLFQFARLDPGARPWLEKYITNNGQGFTATPFQQAVLAARHFDLTPADVRRYVQEIQQGTYKGWG
jgi:hypothetical protein